MCEVALAVFLFLILPIRDWRMFAESCSLTRLLCSCVINTNLKHRYEEFLLPMYWCVWCVSLCKWWATTMVLLFLRCCGEVGWGGWCWYGSCACSAAATAVADVCSCRCRCHCCLCSFCALLFSWICCVIRYGNISFAPRELKLNYQDTVLPVAE